MREGFLATGEYFHGAGRSGGDPNWPWRPIPRWLTKKNNLIHNLTAANAFLWIFLIILTIVVLILIFRK